MATSPSLSSSEKDVTVGGWEIIKDVNSTKVQDLGKFAVDEYNKNHGTHLSFSQVIKAERQLVNGWNYKLLLDAVDGGVSGKYNAVVWEKAAPQTKELISFEPATN